MAIINPNVEWEKIELSRYEADVYIINLYEDKIFEVQSRNVTSIVNISDYMNNFHPILKLNISLAAETFYRLKERYRDIKIKIDFKRYTLNNDNTAMETFNSNTTTNPYEIVYSQIFQPFTEDVGPNIRESIEEQTNNEKDIDLENTAEGEFKLMELILFPEDHLNKNKKIINGILNDCSPHDAVGYLVNQIGINDMLMTPVDNRESFRQIIFPPDNFKKSMDLLSSVYGLYNTGLLQFMDINRFYLLSNSLDKVPVGPNEFENVYINIGSLANSTSFVEGSYKDFDKECYIINLPNTASFKTGGTYSKEITGNVFEVYENKEMLDSTTYDDAGNFSFAKGSTTLKTDPEGFKSEDKKIYTQDKLSNKYNLTDLQREKMDDALSVTLEFNNINLELLTPNKRYLFSFEDIKINELYKGQYRITKLIHGLSRDGDGQSMRISAIAEFKKFEI